MQDRAGVTLIKTADSAGTSSRKTVRRRLTNNQSFCSAPVAIALKTQTGLIETASPAIPAEMISLAVGLRYSSVGMLIVDTLYIL